MVNLPYLQRGFFLYFEPAPHYIFEKCKNEPTIYCIGRGHMLCIVRPQMIQFQEPKIPSVSEYFEICRS